VIIKLGVASAGSVIAQATLVTLVILLGDPDAELVCAAKLARAKRFCCV
jgi:hypothetical protein